MEEERVTAGRAVAKEGQPVWLLNLEAEENCGVRQPAQTNVPARFSDSRMEEYGRQCRRF